ncbi:MAG: GNAT family N-acetyltransferase [Acidobacteriota bacterium]|nr:GNAT family N-acetyltransferase [Acidobacteriota bacterium]
MRDKSFSQLESARLRLRRFAAADLAAFVAYRNDPLVARYQSWETYGEQEAIEFLRHQADTRPGAPGEWTQFAVELKATGALVGDCALHVKADDARQGEIGFTLAREYQGRGYAAEAVARLLDHVFAELQLHRVVAITDCENAASVALLERLGLRREGHFIQNVWFKGRWGNEYLYAVLADEWRGSEMMNAK